MGHLANIFLSLAIVCMMCSCEGRHVKRVKAVHYQLPEDYDKEYHVAYSRGAVSDSMDDASTPQYYSLGPCEDSDPRCHEGASESVSDSIYFGDSSSVSPF